MRIQIHITAAIALLSINTQISAGPLTVNDKWSKVLGAAWSQKEYGECNSTPEQFEKALKSVFTTLGLRATGVVEFDRKVTPKILVGIRCLPIEVPLAPDNVFAIEKPDTYEVTQFYIRLFEPEAGVGHFLIMSRSKQRTGKGPKFSPIAEPPNAWRIANRIRRTLLATLNGDSLVASGQTIPGEGFRIFPDR